MDGLHVLSESARRRRYSPTQARLIRRALCADLTEAEFDLFMEVAETAQLDPMRRQIAALVLNADDIARRRMIPWTTIDGLRVIAARCGDYRPMEAAPQLSFEEARKDPACNPLGLVRAEVRVWKRSGAHWHGVAGEAWWDEYAPLRNQTIGGSGMAPVSAIELDPSWRRMGRLMLAKCAEALALRRGWPDLLSGLYAEDELWRVRAESAAERAAQAEARERTIVLAGARALALVFDEGVETVPHNALLERLERFYASAPSIDAVEAFNNRNRAALQAFWSLAPGAALCAKQVAEARCQRLQRSREVCDEEVAAAPEAQTLAAESAAPADVRPMVEKQVEGSTCAHESARKTTGLASGRRGTPKRATAPEPKKRRRARGGRAIAEDREADASAGGGSSSDALSQL